MFLGSMCVPTRLQSGNVLDIRSGSIARANCVSRLPHAAAPLAPTPSRDFLSKAIQIHCYCVLCFLLFLIYIPSIGPTPSYL